MKKFYFLALLFSITLTSHISADEQIAQHEKEITQRGDYHGKFKDQSWEVSKILNLLFYTETSNSHPAYHSVVIENKYYRGEREPGIRFSHVPYDFTGKTVFDIGCNQGGMLLTIADKIKWGVGIDWDPKVINVANRLKSHHKKTNIDYYVFDLVKEKLPVMGNFLTEEPVDICFLLAMCMWLPNWKEVIDFAYNISHTLLFESNGRPEQQRAQVNYLLSKYAFVQILSETADDSIAKDPRKLYICYKNIDQLQS